ncbi:MAG: ectonucleotide pyrophosphatase/phosphodiesterase [Treponema sp.]|nr:ectonucleotide pyrophosphatase/phosphodiesterase [Treponema sp.]
MLIISFDSISDREYEHLLKFPAFNAFSKQASVFRDVSTVFISNTYPVHTSVATGVLPGVHGITSNTEGFPSPNPVWNSDERMIRVKTIWQLASEKGINTAAVLWPVTGFSRTINYNIPEIRPRPGKSQLSASLKAGSALLQIIMFLRYGKIMKGYKQPELDNFTTACMTDILRKKKPGLALVHLTAYDAICHDNGPGSIELETAYEALDKNLASLLNAADEDVILFSDHSQINVHTVTDPNIMLVKEKLIHQTDNGYLPSQYNCFYECCGGSAFFHAGALSNNQIDELRLLAGQSEGFRRFLTSGEMCETGREDAAFGFCAKSGFCYEISGTEKKGNHGYPLDMPDYKVFYMARGCGLKPGTVTGGSLLDIAPLVLRHLNITDVT